MNAFFHDPPLSVGLAVLAAYLVGLGVVLLRRRPLAVSGGLDGGLLAAALSGLVMAGPLAAVRPLLAAVPWNGPLLVIAYVVGVAGLLLLARPRLVVYNCTVEQLRPLVVEAVAALDSAARWAGGGRRPAVARELGRTVWVPAAGIACHAGAAFAAGLDAAGRGLSALGGEPADGARGSSVEGLSDAGACRSFTA